jgi:amidase
MSSEQPFLGADSALHWWPATRLSSALHAGELSAVEVMSATLDRIDAINDTLNVIVHQASRAECLALAEAADRARATGEPLGLLHGLPIAIKDLNDVAGMPTSHGSRAFAGGPPKTTDAPHVAKLRQAGALIIGKTNTPEFGVGTVTWNDVFGVTRNPFDPARHAGGSSGGVAAVAAGMIPLCDGSDSGGSLRYPASFCNAVGLRTTPGMVPGNFGGNSWDPHAVHGPLARNCEDAALMLHAMSGADPSAPLSVGRHLGAPALSAAEGPIRLAWSDCLGGLPVSTEVREVMVGARATLEAAGIQTVDVEVDFDGADWAWQVIEMFGWYSLLGERPMQNPELYRDDFVRNVREASAYTTHELASAFARRYRLYTEFTSLLTTFDGFVCPTAPVVAPAADLPWVDEVAGVHFDRYLLWQRLACRLTTTSHPVLAMQAGFAGHLPVGMQVVGGYGRDWGLLALGARLEAILGVAGVHPDL